MSLSFISVKWWRVYIYSIYIWFGIIWTLLGKFATIRSIITVFASCTDRKTTTASRNLIIVDINSAISIWPISKAKIQMCWSLHHVTARKMCTDTFYLLYLILLQYNITYVWLSWSDKILPTHGTKSYQLPEFIQI